MKKNSNIKSFVVHPLLFVIFLALFSFPNVRIAARTKLMSYGARWSRAEVLREPKGSNDTPVAYVKGVEAALTLGKLFHMFDSRSCHVFVRNVKDENKLDLKNGDSKKKDSKKKDDGCDTLFKNALLTLWNGEDFKNMSQLMESRVYDGNLSRLQRMMHYVTLTNAIFVLGACMALFASLLLVPLVYKLIETLSFVVVFIYMLVRPLIETVFYVLSMVSFLVALTRPESYAFLVSLFASFAAFGSFLYSSYLHLESGHNETPKFMYAMLTFTLLTFGVDACIFDSALSAFIAIMSFGGIIVIFARDIHYRIVYESLFTLTFFCSIIILEVLTYEQRSIIRPFVVPMYMLGTNGYLTYRFFLVLLSDMDRTRRTLWSVASHDLTFLASAALLYAFGSYRDHYLMVSSSLCFVFFYVCHKYARIAWRTHDITFLLFLLVGGFVLMYLSMMSHLYSGIIWKGFDFSRVLLE
jgi:hypothetical protein